MLIKSAALICASAPALEVKADESGMISGYGSVFGNVDAYGERVMPGAFRKSLASGGMPKLLWQHDQHRPIGKWIEAKEDGTGLLLTGQLNLKTTAGRDAYEHLVAGDVTGLSIGYREVKVTPKGDVRELNELELHEVSIVTFPANRSATLSTVKSLTSKDELIDMLRSGGLSKQAAGLIAAGGWNALSKSPDLDHDAAARLAASIDHATRAIRNL